MKFRKEFYFAEGQYHEVQLGKDRTFCRRSFFGTAGLKILSSRDAKKIYAYTTAAVVCEKVCVMTKISAIKENAEDIYADANEINEKREADFDVVIEDCACEETAETEAE